VKEGIIHSTFLVKGLPDKNKRVEGQFDTKTNRFFKPLKQTDIGFLNETSKSSQIKFGFRPQTKKGLTFLKGKRENCFFWVFF